MRCTYVVAAAFGLSLWGVGCASPTGTDDGMGAEVSDGAPTFDAISDVEATMDASVDGSPETSAETSTDVRGDGPTDSPSSDAVTDVPAPSRCDAPGPSYLGCEFFPTETANSQLAGAFEVSIVIVNPNDFPVTYTLTGPRLTSARSDRLGPGAATTIALPTVPELLQNDHAPGSCGLRYCGATSMTMAGGAFRLVTDGPVAVWQFNPMTYRAGTSFSFTNDASMLLPARYVGRRYRVITRPNLDFRGTDGILRARIGGFVTVVGTAATPTTVTIRRTTGVSAGPGVTGTSMPGVDTYTLARGDVVQLVGDQMSGDLTGSEVDATAPVVVFAGHDCAQVPDSRTACDHLEEQVPPIETLGRRYAVTQPRIRGAAEPHVVRILSPTAGNVLTFNGITPPTTCPALLAAGGFCDVEVATAGYVIEGSMPLLVASFMVGPGTIDTMCFAADGMTPLDRDDPACMGDPSMLIVPPVEQFRSSYAVFVPGSYRRNMINVTVAAGTTMLLDGVAVTEPPVPLGSSGLDAYFIPVATSGLHRLTSSGSRAFGLSVYGLAQYTSYMYAGGTNLIPLP